MGSPIRPDYRAAESVPHADLSVQIRLSSSKPFLASLRIVDDTASEASALSRQWPQHYTHVKVYALIIYMVGPRTKGLEGFDCLSKLTSQDAVQWTAQSAELLQTLKKKAARPPAHNTCLIGRIFSY
jgi:hypothetical protein